MKRLTSKQVLEIHADLISATGGADELRDRAMLLSIVFLLLLQLIAVFLKQAVRKQFSM